MREELTVYPTQQWIIDCRVGYLGLLTRAYIHGKTAKTLCISLILDIYKIIIIVC